MYGLSSGTKNNGEATIRGGSTVYFFLVSVPSYKTREKYWIIIYAVGTGAANKSSCRTDSMEISKDARKNTVEQAALH